MSKHVSLTLFIPIIFIIFLYIYDYAIIKNESQAFEDFVMRKLANYASDAAVEEILFTGDLGMDYADDHVDVQPDLAMREFCYMMLTGLQMPTTEQNIKWMQSHHLKVLMVCAYDGFYMYQYVERAKGDYDFVCTPKIPYFYTDVDGTQYCLNLGFTQGRWDTSLGGNNYRVNAIDDLPSHITHDVQLTAVNNEVSKYLQYGVSIAYGGHDGKTYALPAFASEVSGGQPVNNITVIGVLDTNDATLSRPNLCMSIGGARIVSDDPILGFELNGTKYYGHQSKLQNFISPDIVSRQFNSVYDAAKQGFNFFIRAYE